MMHTPPLVRCAELKFQCWRALAVLADGGERLLYVGRSAPHVQAGYADAFAEILDGQERGCVRGISLQCWEGASDQGRWVGKAKLPLPAPAETGSEAATQGPGSASKGRGRPPR
jgi:hypothetical protein